MKHTHVHTMSRRALLATTAATAAIATIGLSTPAMAACSHNHKKLGYRLGTQMVDPNLSRAEKAKLFANARCPDCGTAIEPDGLSYGEHMPEWGWGA